MLIDKRDPNVDKDIILNDRAHSPEHNSENRIKKFQAVQKLKSLF